MSEVKDRWDKFDVVGKIVSSVLLTVITILLGIYTFNYQQSEDKKAATLKRAQLIESMINDLSQSDNKVKLDIALSVLDHSSSEEEKNSKEKDEKYSELVTNIIRRVVLNMGEIDAETREFALDILKKRKPEIADEIAKELKEKVAGKQVDSEDQKNSISSADGGETKTTTQKPENETEVISETKPKILQMKKANVAPVIQQITAVFKTVVYIQIHDESERGTANQLRTLLNQQKDTIAPGIELVAGNYPDRIRYFNADDKDSAAQVTQTVNNFFNSKGCSAKFDTQEFKNFKAPKGQFEVWINMDCAKS